MSMDPDDVEHAVALAQYIEAKLRLLAGFVAGLLNETDWSFVIKLNAIFESLHLGLIGPTDRQFLEALAELRNSLAHSVENLGFEFVAWVGVDG